MLYHFCADTLFAVSIPPLLFAVVGAEQSRPCAGRVGYFTTTVFANGLGLGDGGNHTISAAESFDGADRDSKGCGYSGVSGILLTHDHDLSFL